MVKYNKKANKNIKNQYTKINSNMSLFVHK